MTDVSILGTGNMGAAIARALLRAGVSVTAWNRTPARAESLRADGARLAGSAAEAIAASPLSILVLFDYAAVQQVLGEQVLAVARGNVLVNLTTGTASEAEAVAATAATAGIRYLNGGIMAYPRDIGTADIAVLYSGDHDAYRQHETTLEKIAGASRFVGHSPSAASVLFGATSIHYYISLGGFLESAALARRAGVEPDEYATVLQSVVQPMLRRSLADLGDRIVRDRLVGDQATIDVVADGGTTLVALLREAGIRSQVMEAVDAYLQEARGGGMGSLDTAALYKLVSRD